MKQYKCVSLKPVFVKSKLGKLRDQKFVPVISHFVIIKKLIKNT